MHRSNSALTGIVATIVATSMPCCSSSTPAVEQRPLAAPTAPREPACVRGFCFEWPLPFRATLARPVSVDTDDVWFNFERDGLRPPGVAHLFNGAWVNSHSVAAGPPIDRVVGATASNNVWGQSGASYRRFNGAVWSAPVSLPFPVSRVVSETVLGDGALIVVVGRPEARRRFVDIVRLDERGAALLPLLDEAATLDEDEQLIGSVFVQSAADIRVIVYGRFTFPVLRTGPIYARRFDGGRWQTWMLPEQPFPTGRVLDTSAVYQLFDDAVVIARFEGGTPSVTRWTALGRAGSRLVHEITYDPTDQVHVARNAIWIVHDGAVQRLDASALRAPLRCPEARIQRVVASHGANAVWAFTNRGLEVVSEDGCQLVAAHAPPLLQVEVVSSSEAPDNESVWLASRDESGGTGVIARRRRSASEWTSSPMLRSSSAPAPLRLTTGAGAYLIGDGALHFDGERWSPLNWGADRNHSRRVHDACDTGANEGWVASATGLGRRRGALLTPEFPSGAPATTLDCNVRGKHYAIVGGEVWMYEDERWTSISLRRPKLDPPPVALNGGRMVAVVSPFDQEARSEIVTWSGRAQRKLLDGGSDFGLPAGFFFEAFGSLAATSESDVHFVVRAASNRGSGERQDFVLRYDGRSVQPRLALPQTPAAHSFVTAIGQDDVLVWQQRGSGTIIRLRGGVRSELPPLSEGAIDKVYAASPELVWAVTATVPPRAFALNERAWVEVLSLRSSVGDTNRIDMHVASAQDVWAITAPKGLWHFDGRDWRAVAEPSIYEITRVWVAASDDVWFETRGGSVYRGDATRGFRSVATIREAEFIFGSGPNAVWAGLRRWNGSAFEPVERAVGVTELTTNETTVLAAIPSSTTPTLALAELQSDGSWTSRPIESEMLGALFRRSPRIVPGGFRDARQRWYQGAALYRVEGR